MIAETTGDNLRPSDYPAEILKDWAQVSLGAERCSVGYLKVLASLLRRMKDADLYGVRIEFKTTASHTGRQTLRNLLTQLCTVGLLRRGPDLKRATFLYQGCTGWDITEDAAARYAHIQREGEDAAFQRYVQRIGVCSGECPY